MKSMHRILSFALASVMALSLTACKSQSDPGPAASSNKPGSSSSGAPVTPAQSVKIRFGHSGTEDHQYQVFASKFKEIVEAESEGRIAVEIFPSAVLGNDREMIEGMLMGQQEMFVGSSTTSWVPETAVTDMPFLYRDYDHAYRCYDGFLFDELGKRFEDDAHGVCGYRLAEHLQQRQAHQLGGRPERDEDPCSRYGGLLRNFPGYGRYNCYC